VAVTPGGNLLVSVGALTGETGGTRIQEYNSSGTMLLGEFGSGTIGGSLGVTATGSDVYVADRINKKVWKYSLVAQHSLGVTKSGTGTGTVTSDPAGINCGGTCSAEFNESSIVTLTQLASVGSEFKGWTGACTGIGICEVTMSAAKNVGAQFDLTVEKVLTVTKGGTGTGTVTSDPAGINCGATCSDEFPENSLVTLTQSPGPNSVFAGWAGACTGMGACEVTMSANKSVTATFNLEQHLLTVTKSGAGAGGGTVTSDPAGIICAPSCSCPFDR
jgi:hypothetical protein